jgi:hypothetical protein
MIVLDIAASAFIGLLAGALLAVVGNIVGGTPTRILITTVASAVIGAGLGVVGVIRSGRPGEKPARRVPYVAVLRDASSDDQDGRTLVHRRNGMGEAVRG